LTIALRDNELKHPPLPIEEEAARITRCSSATPFPRKSTPARGNSLSVISIQIEVFIIEVDSVDSTQGNPNPKDGRQQLTRKPAGSGRVRVSDMAFLESLNVLCAMQAGSAAEIVVAFVVASSFNRRLAGD